MRIALVGKAGSITHWLEDAAAAWRAEGHDVRLLFVRRPWLAEAVERTLAPLIAERLAAALGRFAPDLVLAIGAYHIPEPLLAAIDEARGEAPLVRWVGDAFDAAAAPLAGRWRTQPGLYSRALRRRCPALSSGRRGKGDR